MLLLVNNDENCWFSWMCQNILQHLPGHGAIPWKLQRRLIVDLRDIFVVGISFKSWKPFFHCHVIRWTHDEQRTVYICLVIRVFPVDLKLECTVIEKTLKNTSLDENVAITLQKSLYFTEIEVWLTIDNSEIDVLLEQLSASDTWIYRFDLMKAEFLLW